MRYRSAFKDITRELQCIIWTINQKAIRVKLCLKLIRACGVKGFAEHIPLEENHHCDGMWDKGKVRRIGTTVEFCHWGAPIPVVLG
jgi:hypothetical protein